ncbi:hypothetical protein SLEP1_g26543 [Rubroshorea leprosula]|uniref:Uncharacterized protein n=1 Tax=Rubroshorea leprosula TaxID=152421 RepID=A0AAV5JQ91_9ROSI|nr:hypothetical protein SLEP1_g26543 [Rubroshorea leprosula]
MQLAKISVDRHLVLTLAFGRIISSIILPITRKLNLEHKKNMKN